MGIGQWCSPPRKIKKMEKNFKDMHLESRMRRNLSPTLPWMSRLI